MAYLNTCTMLFVQWGKESSPYWSIKKPLLFPAPHGSVICRKARKHIVFPLSCKESWFSHQNSPFSSFQLIKGQLDISLLHQPQLCLVEMGHVKVLVPKTFSPETNGFTIRASDGEIWKRSKNHPWSVCLCVPVSDFHNIQVHRQGEWNMHGRIFIYPYLYLYLCTYVCIYRKREHGDTQVHTYFYFFLINIMYVIHYIYVGRNKKVVTWLVSCY